MNDNTKSEKKSTDIIENKICPNCGSGNIKKVVDKYNFTYGSGRDAANLSAMVPITKCHDCGECFLNYEAEDICHETICRHLGVMTPAQIKNLRKLNNLTQSQFSELTKLGEATLSRWERGILIQNQAYDNYLYLLGFEDNIKQIKDRTKSGQNRENIRVEHIQPIFRELEVGEELLNRKNQFKLIPDRTACI